jgi:hypothetical protein
MGRRVGTSLNEVFMFKRVRGACLVAAAFVLGSGPRVLAQEGVEVAASYDVLYREFGETSVAGAHVSAAVPIAYFKGVAEVGFNRFDGATVSSYLAGGQWKLGRASRRIEPSVQLLLGAWRCCGETNVVFQPGVLVDYRYRPSLAIRGALAVRRIFIGDFDDANAVRVSAGVVWKLSR